MRTLRVDLTAGELDLIRWAQRVCRASMAAHRAVGIVPFVRGALFAGVGNVMDDVLARGGGNPAGCGEGI